MKNFYLLVLFVGLVALTHVHANNEVEDLTKDFIVGDPGIESINALAFGPSGILFVGDAQKANVVAIDTKDTDTNAEVGNVNMNKVDEKIAALLGANVEDLQIIDMAVNPLSQNIYFAIRHSNGTPMLIKTDGESMEVMPMDKVSHSKVELSNPVAEDAKDRRGRALRRWAVSDVAYHDGKLMVSGLSNEEFSSTFRSIPFPFKTKQMHASLEIYHAAHGRYETYAPIKTFMPFELNGEAHIVASYTCTPLVLFPMSEVKAGEHTKGRTVAELGNRNTPLDIIHIEKDGASFFLMNNTSRPVMKIAVDEVAAYKDYLTEPVKGNSMTAGVDYISLPYVNVLQMDKYGDGVLMLQRRSNGDLALFTTNKNRL
ncbi:MAG: hypothetical protein HRU41_28065 [Saprospiraceae bacterium]|nr:hypothetical protein [Saprospiraceae bacterium]